MDYYNFSIKTKDEATAEIIMALLSELPFDTFQETATGLDAFLPASAFTEKVETEATAIAHRFEGTVSKIFIKGQNWNALWESNFAPIQVGNFCTLRADFHPPDPTVKFDLLINPKMAFGTGHHATTYMMIDAMKDFDFVGKKVLDFGCGTGVLAILASKMGAAKLEAVDIEAPAFENAKENLLLNHIENVSLFLGGLEQITSVNFDCILANINRNVILSSFQSLYEKLNQNGNLLISGILVENEPEIMQTGKATGFQHMATFQREDWLCMHWKK